MKDMRAAQNSFLINIPFILLSVFLMTLVGIILYSYFYVIGCDPIEGGIISNGNQISLLFMLHILEDLPGLGGLYMATIFSGALSTLSSGINSLAANTVEDIFAGCLRNFSEKTVTTLAKVTAIVYGLAILGVTYFAQSLQGPVTQLANAIFGACGSVVVAMFIMGSTVPWVNKYGAFVGGLISLSINIWIVVGKQLYGKKPNQLPAPPTDKCYLLFQEDLTHNSTLLLPVPSLAVNSSCNVSNANYPAYNYDEYGFFLYDISYIWYALIGIIMCSVMILIVSKLTNGHDNKQPEARLIFPIVRRFWHLDKVSSNDEVDLGCEHL